MKITRRTFTQLALPLIIPSLATAAEGVPARLALVIGNGTYEHNDPLPNALRDSKALAEKLGRLGFQIESKSFDLNKDQLSKAIEAFGEKLRTAGPNIVGFFYYAGHAAQDGLGVNYLLPVDARARTPAEVRAEGTPIQLLIKAMEDSDNAVNIIILDACRDWFKHDRSIQDPKGLHDMGLHASLLIAYATRADDTASEGGSLESSPYSNRLLEALDKQAHDPIVLLLDDVKTRVYSDTDAGQYPLVVDGLTVSGRWSFESAALSSVPNKPEPVGAPVAPTSYLAGLDKQKLTGFFRRQDTFVDALLARRDVLEKYGINTPNRLAYFLGAIGYETGGFRLQEERFGFSVAALRARWPRKVTSREIAERIAGKPELVADYVYADTLGNGPPESGDGWKYRGRGFFFVTGKGNYKKYGNMIGVDLINSPDLVSDLETAYSISAAIWSSNKCNEAADSNDLSLSTRRFLGLRGQVNNLPARQIWLRQARDALGI